MSPAPTATYRLQLNDGFTFADAEHIIDYLAGLGISHLYLSPCLETVEHSSHGYDTVDYSQINSQLGGATAFESLCNAAKTAGMRIILDTVPNHMAVTGRRNKWWWDVLRNGPSSKYAGYFDIDWSVPEEGQWHRIVVPILGDRYGNVLARGDIHIRNVDSEFVVEYNGNEFPLTESSLADIDDVNEINANRERLHNILEQQNYRLAYWELAGEDHEYRRFFDINSLIALRQDRREVFDATNRVPLQLLAAGHIHGLRIDHIDGLASPAQYLEWLRASADAALIYVEKILQTDERLRSTWPVDGTTGYDAIQPVDGLFIDPEGETALEKLFREFTGYGLSWNETVATCKLDLLNESFSGDVSRICDDLEAAFADNVDARDFSHREIRRVVITLASFLPVYRTYVDPENNYAGPDDLTYVEQAVVAAKTEFSGDMHELIERVADVLTLHDTGDFQADFVRRFQQLTGPLMAKGVEDRALYRYNVLTALNEVGASPDHFGTRPDEFHDRCAEIAKLWPNTMVTSTTHDTKRSEDHRHRVALLSEITSDWASTVDEWDAICSKYISGEETPDSSTRYLLYQTLVGAWPIEIERVQQYMTKAVREAAIRTSWKSPNAEYETLLRGFVAEIYGDKDFMKSLEVFVSRLIEPGRINSLAATVLKCMMPGVPDIYQGTELWAHHLVDPDNRQPVDYTTRSELLAETTSRDRIPPIDDSGAVKQFVLARLLQLRSQLASDAESADRPYQQIVCRGTRAANVVAFARAGAIVAVPRLVMSLNGQWLDTSIELPNGTWRDIFTGATHQPGNLSLASLFDSFPVSVLVKQ